MDYRKKPVTIQALKWDGSNADEIIKFTEGAAKKKGKGLVIATLEGDHKATKGDIIIRGVQGEFYPCKPDIFAETYDDLADADGVEEPDTPPTALPEYVSHKVVRAGKILAAEQALIGDEDMFRLDVDGLGEAYVPFNFYARGGPFEDDLGYLVIYEDGYQSWTPSKPFEEGYALKSAISLPAHDDLLDAALFATKTLHNSTVSGAKQNVSDLVVVGNGDMFRLLCKASSQSEGWMKSTKAMSVAGGAVVQVTTQQRNPDGSYAVAEALTFVPGGEIMDDVNGGRKLKGGR